MAKVTTEKKDVRITIELTDVEASYLYAAIASFAGNNYLNGISRELVKTGELTGHAKYLSVIYDTDKLSGTLYLRERYSYEQA
jgi:hypothetical protein